MIVLSVYLVHCFQSAWKIHLLTPLLFFLSSSSSSYSSSSFFSVLHQWGDGSACRAFRRDLLRDKIREVGRGLSLADTQTGRYGRLYSRRRLCARRGADARLLLLWILVARAPPTADRPNPILLYNWVLDTDTGTGPIPSITVSRVNAYRGGVLARALPEGLRYLST